jgi:tRNA-(ms[2]io[6]A)-hydroxylase
MTSVPIDISHILEFLGCSTPAAWVEEARKPEHLKTLLTDHANLERKAAESAISTMKRYGNGIPGIANSGIRKAGSGAKKAGSTGLNPQDCATGLHELLNKLSRLAREELRHFEQVIAIMQARGVDYPPLSASRYAGEMRKQVRSQEPGRLVDTLLVGAIIEARSCERFAVLVPELDEQLAAFYASLLKSESRHFRDYLTLARGISSPQDVAQRLEELLARERVLIESPDEVFRFHSGVPA